MSANDVWQEFEVLRHNVKLNTVDRLKQILAGFNDECGTHFSKSGKKQDIIDRIVHTIDSWKQANQVDKWLKAKTILYQVRNSGTYTPTRASLHPTSSMASNSFASTSSIGKTSSYNTSGPGLSANSFSHPYPRKPVPPLGSSPVPSFKSSGGSKPELRFKDSPFFRVHETLSSVVECQESQNAGDRKQAILTFTLNQDQINKLKAAGSKYHLRLFCTSSLFYFPNPTFRSLNTQCPIEFPSTCEVRVNQTQITASLKGLKKKPGTAPPPELDRYVKFSTDPNRVDMVYVNSQQPSQPKKFYLVVKLVESTSVSNLVEKLKRDRFESSETIKRQMQASTLEDDDIVAGPQKVSLKCPLTLARINTPCRSSKCVHVQCFDATSWFSVNEQTTTWLCPVCEKTLEVNDLIIDGFSESILKDCPESVDDVMVEADGEWHTSDNKYGSLNWKIKHPPKSTNASPPKPTSPPKVPLANGSSSANPNGLPKKPDVEITVLDSDDEDEGRVKRELSPSVGNLSSAPTSAGQAASRPIFGDVIDLTIDSDDDDPLPRSAEKRKASDVSPTEGIWKKARTNDDPTPASSSSHVNGAQHINSSRPDTSAPATTIRLPSFNHPPSLPSFHTSFAGTPTNGIPQLPPINDYRRSSSSNSRWA